MNEHPEDYFMEYPEEEDEFIAEIARLEEEKFVEYPEEWPLNEWLTGA